MSPDPTTGILREVDDMLSRLRAVGMDRSLPNGTGDEMWVAAATEAIRITDDRKRGGTVAWSDVVLERTFMAISARSDEWLRGQLIRLAATVTAWVEDIDRKAGK